MQWQFTAVWQYVWLLEWSTNNFYFEKVALNDGRGRPIKQFKWRGTDTKATNLLPDNALFYASILNTTFFWHFGFGKVRILNLLFLQMKLLRQWRPRRPQPPPSLRTILSRPCREEERILLFFPRAAQLASLLSMQPCTHLIIFYRCRQWQLPRESRPTLTVQQRPRPRRSQLWWTGSRSPPPSPSRSQWETLACVTRCLT